MICPKCGYKRKQQETAPEGQCPSCGIYYHKYQEQERQDFVARTARPAPERTGGAAGGSLAMVAGVLVVSGLVSAFGPGWLRPSDSGRSVPYSGDIAGKDFSSARITMYSLTTCGYCVAMRHKLEANKIPFNEYFVDTDQARQQELFQKLQQSGFRGGGIGTPTLEVNGKMMPNNPSFEDVVKQALS